MYHLELRTLFGWTPAEHGERETIVRYRTLDAARLSACTWYLDELAAVARGDMEEVSTPLTDYRIVQTRRGKPVAFWDLDADATAWPVS